MARVIVLDSGPLGEACHPRGGPITLWRVQALLNGAMIVVPEIADYEVRRKLLQREAHHALALLDKLQSELCYTRISTSVMREAAQLWANARNRGIATADNRALDCDVILAAQARLFVGGRDTLTIATDNPAHLSRYVGDARPWRTINP